MGKCNIDHTYDDVVKKLESQTNFLPSQIVMALHHFLKDKHDQEVLNDLFHLLKKYDLASEDERKERDNKLMERINIIR